MVSYWSGDRSSDSCWRLWNWIPHPYRTCVTFSDFWLAYAEIFGQLAPLHFCVGKETGFTAHVERWNLTLRQLLGRFVRKSLSFSKSDEFHAIALKLFIHHYNSSLPLSVRL